MKTKKYIVDLTSEERQELLKLTKKGSQPVRRVLPNYTLA